MDAMILIIRIQNWLASQQRASATRLVSVIGEIVILGDKDFYGLESDKAKNEIIKIIIALKESYLSARRQEISRLIQELERDGRVEEAEN